MKRLPIIFMALLLQFSLTACNNENDNVSNIPENIPVEQNYTSYQGSVERTVNDPFNFTEFDLDVYYDQNLTFDVDYESEQDEIEAEVKDDTRNINLSGDEAFSKLYPLFKKLTFDENTPDDEVISQVLDTFNVNEGFLKFELDVTFTNGVEKEYQI